MATLPALDTAVRRFRRRVVVVRTLHSVQAAVLALAGIVIFGVIALRLFDVHAVPEPIWLVALLLPVGFGILQGLRATPGAAAFAAHVDRRGQGRGLLLASLERDPGSWGEDVSRHLAVADKALPRVRALRPVVAVLASVTAVALLGLLPRVEPSLDTGAGTRAIASAIEAAREELDLVEELELVDEQEAAALEQRLDALEQRLADQEAVGWSDVDAFVDAVREASEESARGHEAVRARSAELANALASRDADERDRRELGAIAARAQELGMFEGLPPDVREALESLARRGGSGDGTAGGEQGGAALDPDSLDAERIRDLARALADRGRVRLDHARDKLAGKVDTEALQRLLDEQGAGSGSTTGPMQAQGEGWDPNPGEDGDGAPGRGGISRGRGDATLDHLGATEIDLSGMRAEQLPDGVAPPDKWDLAGIGRAEPEVAPERAAGGGTPAPASGPGAASARRDLAPRHREAVRRFFEGGGR